MVSRATEHSKGSQSESSSGSRSHTPSPGKEEAITFITSFGGSEDESASGHATQTPAGTGSKRAPHSQASGTSSGRKEASRSVTLDSPQPYVVWVGLYGGGREAQNLLP
ncbi:hypothetical protein AB205_0155890 [Aquarana catesbeiana]|uniref:Uncharacterized protein n=1 Tax=Aquarana catesbeiana TaxID=8400 RepID=A0A2G9SA82_AQUCT|nr:hypothetical protein AB205_0155890 [Aquarana catesbeiana]